MPPVGRSNCPAPVVHRSAVPASSCRSRGPGWYCRPGSAAATTAAGYNGPIQRLPPVLLAVVGRLADANGGAVPGLRSTVPVPVGPAGPGNQAIHSLPRAWQDQLAHIPPPGPVGPGCPWMPPIWLAPPAVAPAVQPRLR